MSEEWTIIDPWNELIQQLIVDINKLDTYVKDTPDMDKYNLGDLLWCICELKNIAKQLNAEAQCSVDDLSTTNNSLSSIDEPDEYSSLEEVVVQQLLILEG